MSRFESPGQVVLLFVGAALISVLLIALLNAEARSRKLKEPEIDNETVFTVLGRRIAQLAQKWRQSDQPQLIRSRRSLQSVAETAEEPHPVRHRGRHSRVHRSSTPSPPTAAAATTTPRLLVAPHDTCYSTHEVLFIIALTCAVNFAFIFVIMGLVHVCNRGSTSSSSSCKSTGLPGLDSLDVPEECLAARSASCNGVQEYINNLPPARTPSLSSIPRSSTTPQLQPSYSMEDLLFAG